MKLLSKNFNLNQQIKQIGRFLQKAQLFLKVLHYRVTSIEESDNV